MGHLLPRSDRDLRSFWQTKYVNAAVDDDRRVRVLHLSKVGAETAAALLERDRLARRTSHRVGLVYPLEF